MSKIYLDRKNPDSPYVFISYSHKDSAAVQRVLTALNDKGADFWYDTDLHMGQDWYKRVCQVTDDKRCMGILYFVSPEFVYSDACFDELELLDKLTKTHAKFESACVLLGDEETPGFNMFKTKSMQKLLMSYADKPDAVVKAVARISEKFDSKKTYCAVTYDNIDDEENVKKLFDEVFKAWGCASEEVGALDALQSDELVDRAYRVKTTCSIYTDRVHRRDTEWKVFAYSGNTLSAMLVSDELYAETCLSLAQTVMSGINDNVITSLDKIDGRVAEQSDKQDAAKSHEIVKYILFEEAFLQCLQRDENGHVLRYLRSTEREKYFLQLREALEKVSIADAADDGYFFVMDGKGKIMFSDRGSDDVYRHVHVDAYASVVPVIDIDYTKYREYVLATSRA